MTHTLQQDFEHFLSYSGLSSESEDVRAKLLVAYTANWSALGKGHVIQRLTMQRDSAVSEFEDWRFTNKIDELQRLCDAKQAKIDALMLEFCPEEMTPEQVKTWGEHQRAVSDSELEKLMHKHGLIGVAGDNPKLEAKLINFARDITREESE